MTIAVEPSRRPPATPGLPRRPARLTDQVLLERLRLLGPLAVANRGSIPLTDPRRIGAVEFTWLLAEARRRGVPTRELTAATGMRWPTLDQRLRRHAMTATVPPSIAVYQGRQVQLPKRDACKLGHPFTPENTYLFTDSGGGNHRSCRRCRADREARRRAARKAEPTRPKDDAYRGPAAGPGQDNRRRRDQQNRSDSTVPGSASDAAPERQPDGLLTLTQVADLQERETGVRPARATLRSYLSREQMPAQVQPGRWAEDEIRTWLRHGRARRSPTRLAPILDRLTQAIAAGDSREVERAVRTARAAGASWERVAGALGVSKQAAWKRYRTRTST